MRSRPWIVWLAAAGLVALVVAVFAPVRQHDFVTYDDLDFVVNNPNVNHGLTAASVRWAFAPANAYQFTGGPLTWLSHMLDFQLLGRTPGSHHVVNVLLHALNTVLLLLVLCRMTGAVGRSACVAALFALHPLHVESVAWISERKDVLSTTFWMLTTAAYVAYVRRPGAGRYAGVFILLTLGLLTKPVLATLPFTLLLLDVWPLARAPLSWAERHRWRPLLLEKIPLILAGAGVMFVTVWSQQQMGAVSATAALPWPLRVANATVSYVTHLRKMVWPADLAVFYPYPAHISIVTLCVSILVLAALSVVAWRAARSHPYVTVGWLWYIGTLIPMIGLVQVGSHAMADRYTYVSLIGVFVAIVWSVAEFAAPRPLARRVAPVLGCVVIALCAVTARAQVNTWRDSETMWRHALAVTSGNFRANAGMAEVVAGRGNVDSAISYYKEAVRQAPDAVEWQVNLGLLLAEKGDVEEAASAFRRALALRPDDAEAHNNLGAMLARLGAMNDAIAHYRRSLELRPVYPLARRNLGLALAGTGDVSGGLRECLDALRQSPGEAQWHYEVALMLIHEGRNADAIAQLQETIRLQPQHQAARDVLSRVGK